MKIIFALFLLVSLTVNAVLWFDALETRTASPAPLADTGKPSPGSSVSEAAKPLPSTRAVEAGATHEQHWSQFPTGDLQTLAAYLKEHGYPHHVVRGIISHYLDREYQPRRRELQAQAGPIAYWKQNSFASMNANQRAELRALSRAQTERLNAIIGTPDETVEENVRQAMAQRYGPLPAATLWALQSIEQDYTELTMQIRSESRGITFSSDREKLALLEQERRKDLLSVLTPEQFEEFELRTSQTSMHLRQSLIVFEPTAEEFRTLHRLQKSFDEHYNSPNVRRTDPAFHQERQAAERDLIAAAKAELGEERGSEYEKSRDFNYVQAHAFAKQLNLPRESGERLWQLQKNAFEEFGRIGSGPGSTTEQRSQAQLEYVKGIKASLIAEIGEDNLPSYQKAAGGWLASLEQTALRGSGQVIQRTAAPVPVVP